MKPDLLKLKPLKNLKEVHKTYLNFFKKHNKWKHYNCPVCDTFPNKKVLVIDRFRYTRCLNCGNIYNSHQFNVPLDYEIYRKKLVKPSEKLRYKLGVKKYMEIQPYCSQGTLLDVGCGTGQLLDIFEERGWIAIGVEPSGVNTDNIFNCTFEKFETKIKFDCITFYGVLEHVNNPLELLIKAKGMLKKGGIIVAEFPSADSFLMAYLERHPFSPLRFIEHGRHLSFFSEKTIDHICKQLKFEILDIKTVGFDLQTIYLKSDEKLIRLQELFNQLLIADHYRVFLRPIYEKQDDINKRWYGEFRTITNSIAY